MDWCRKYFAGTVWELPVHQVLHACIVDSVKNEVNMYGLGLQYDLNVISSARHIYQAIILSIEV